MKQMRCAGVVMAGLVLVGGGPGGAQPSEDRPTLEPADYGQWEQLGFGYGVSPDGQWLAYQIRRVNRETELRVLSLSETPGEEIVLPWGSAPKFSADSAFLAWTIGVSEEERDRLKEEGEPIRDGAGLLELASGERKEHEQVASWSFDSTGRFLALLGYPPEKKGVAEAPEVRGADFAVLDLESGGRTSLGNVSEMAWSDLGSHLAMTISTGSGEKGGGGGNGVQIFDASSGRLRSLDSSSSTYGGLAWRREALDLAALRSVGDAVEESKAQRVLAWRDLGSEANPILVELSQEAIGTGLEVVSSGGLSWSDDGRALALGLRPRDESDAAGTEASEEGVAEETEGEGGEGEEKKDEDLPGLQIWHTNDVRIFPRQKVAEDQDAKRSLRAVWQVEDSESLQQVGTEVMGEVELIRDSSGGWTHALEQLDQAYPWGARFGRPYHDVWVVDPTDGSREKALERVRYSWSSPGGRYLLWFDGDDWWTKGLAAGASVNLTSGIDTDFEDTLYDTPTDLLPPHGVGGWLEGDEAVLLYDRFDVWRMSPDGSSRTRVTRGAEDEVVHRVAEVDPREDDELDLGIDPERPVYFNLRGERTEQRGYALLLPGADVADLVVLEDRMFQQLTRAREAEVLVHRSEAADDSPDYFVSGPGLESPRQVTRTNPFQGDYAWHRAELVDFRSEADRELQAVLLYPADYTPGRRYPMIVYTYEILAPTIHTYRAPDERRYYNQTVWAQQGYFVLMPDIVYQAREPGVSALQSVRAAVEAIVDRGLVDEDRVGLIGHSWGGYQAAYLPTRTDIFAASVAGAPLTDFVSFMGQIHWNPGIAELTHWETGQARMEVPFWEDPEAYRRNSPIHEVHEMTTPMLMMFGNEDGVVDWDQGTEFFNFARRAEKQMVLLVYEGEDHGLREKKNQIDYHRRILEWFGHYLKGEPAPKWITDGIPVLELDDEKRRLAPPPEPEKEKETEDDS